MTPEAGRYLDKANRLLGEADTMLDAKLYEAAGRTAYLAASMSRKPFCSSGWPRSSRPITACRGVPAPDQR